MDSFVPYSWEAILPLRGLGSEALPDDSSTMFMYTTVTLPPSPASGTAPSSSTAALGAGDSRGDFIPRASATKTEQEGGRTSQIAVEEGSGELEVIPAAPKGRQQSMVGADQSTGTRGPKATAKSEWDDQILQARLDFQLVVPLQVTTPPPAPAVERKGSAKERSSSKHHTPSAPTAWNYAMWNCSATLADLKPSCVEPQTYWKILEEALRWGRQDRARTTVSPFPLIHTTKACRVEVKLSARSAAASITAVVLHCSLMDPQQQLPRSKVAGTHSGLLERQGTVDVTSSSNSGATPPLSSFLLSICQTTQRNSKEAVHCESLRTRVAEGESALLKAAEERLVNEERLFAAFLPILNAKKQKIRQLTMSLHHAQERIIELEAEAMARADSPPPAEAEGGVPLNVKAALGEQRPVQEEVGLEDDPLGTHGLSADDLEQVAAHSEYLERLSGTGTVAGQDRMLEAPPQHQQLLLGASNEGGQPLDTLGTESSGLGEGSSLSLYAAPQSRKRGRDGGNVENLLDMPI